MVIPMEDSQNEGALAPLSAAYGMEYKLTFVPCNVTGLTVPVTTTICFPAAEI